MDVDLWICDFAQLVFFHKSCLRFFFFDFGVRLLMTDEWSLDICWVGVHLNISHRFPPVSEQIKHLNELKMGFSFSTDAKKTFEAKSRKCNNIVVCWRP